MNAFAVTGTIVEVRAWALRDDRHATILVAVDRPGAARGADLIPVSARGRPAEACARFLRRGMRIAIEGSIRGRSTTGGSEREPAVEIVAASVHFVGQAATRAAAQHSGEATMAS